MQEQLLPNFLGIGAVKAGTTWLYQNLYQHNQLYLPATKPVFYFDRHRNRPIESYSAIFRPGADRIRGEFTASYSVLPAETIEYIRRLMPDLKLIFLMREPKARAWSEARMEFSVVRGLGDAKISDAEYCTFICSDTCRSRGDYRGILTNWMRAFPRDRIFVGLTDDVRERPKLLFRQVLSFLGVSSDVDLSDYPLREKVFEGLAVTMPPACRDLLDDMYDREHIRELSDFVGIDLVHRWGYA
jgi:hypothetical protein